MILGCSIMLSSIAFLEYVLCGFGAINGWKPVYYHLGYKNGKINGV